MRDEFEPGWVWFYLIALVTMLAIAAVVWFNVP